VGSIAPGEVIRERGGISISPEGFVNQPGIPTRSGPDGGIGDELAFGHFVPR